MDSRQIQLQPNRKWDKIGDMETKTAENTKLRAITVGLTQCLLCHCSRCTSLPTMKDTRELLLKAQAQHLQFLFSRGSIPEQLFEISIAPKSNGISDPTTLSHTLEPHTQ